VTSQHLATPEQQGVQQGFHRKATGLQNSQVQDNAWVNVEKAPGKAFFLVRVLPRSLKAIFMGHERHNRSRIGAESEPTRKSAFSSVFMRVCACLDVNRSQFLVRCG